MEATLMLESANKNFKIIIVKMLQNLYDTLGLKDDQPGNFRKCTEAVKIEHVNPKLKNTVPEIEKFNEWNKQQIGHKKESVNLKQGQQKSSKLKHKNQK